MKSREWYEDSIHRLLERCLPFLPKSDIRPAYQKTKQNNPMGVNYLDAHDSMLDGVVSAQNKTDLVYFWWHFDPLDMLSTSVDLSDGSFLVSSVVPFRLTVTCYGKNSMSNAIRVRAFFRSPVVFTEMLQMNAVLSSEPTLTTFAEEINEEWWERTDVELAFNVLVDDFSDDGANPFAGSTEISQGYSTATDNDILVGDVNE